MTYLDYNATSPVKPAVRVAILEALECTGNPSSVHGYGRSAKRYVDEARSAVAAMVGVKPTQVIFTSGGTEANNMVFHGQTTAQIATSSIEHDSVLAATKGSARLPVSKSGVINTEEAEEIFSKLPQGSFVSVMLVNNETGVIQPIQEIVARAKKYGLLVHTDAVQAAGKLALDFHSLGVDCLSLSAHKIGGPQGVGALIVRESLTLPSLIMGGGQEINRRAGTENVPGIVGFGVAARLTADDLRDAPRLEAERDRLQNKIIALSGSDVSIAGLNAPRVAGTLNVALRGVPSETFVVAMDLAGVAISAGSACSSGKVKPSHVLKAMGYEDAIAGSAIRISIGWATQSIDIDRCYEAWAGFYNRKRNQHKTAA